MGAYNSLSSLHTSAFCLLIIKSGVKPRNHLSSQALVNWQPERIPI